MKFRKNKTILNFVLFGLCVYLIVLLHFRTHSKSKKVKVFKDGVYYDPNRLFDIPKFKYLISKSECGRDGVVPLFITLIHSSATTSADRRAALRKTWAHSDPRTRTYFLMGMVESPSVQKTIEEEEKQFNDIIQGNFVDSYRNLTYKHTMALRWFTENCPHIKYLLKVDDDVFVNVPAMHEYLLNNTQDTLYMAGNFFKTAQPYRIGKWAVTDEEYVDKEYPSFIGGQFIIYSTDVALEVYKRTFTTRFLWLDDVYMTALIRNQLNIKPRSIEPYEFYFWNYFPTKEFPEPMFIISKQLETQAVIDLWNWTEPHRQSHPYKKP